MLSIITDPQDPLLDYVKDDPVRPEIPREFRVARNRFVSALVEETTPSPRLTPLSVLSSSHRPFQPPVMLFPVA